MPSRIRTLSNPYKDWYARNSTTYNLNRRNKYKNDADIREKARKQAARYRETVRDTGVLPKLRGGLCTSTRLANMLGVSLQTIRNWETRGLIPKPNIPGKHRLYTHAQVCLLLDMVSASADKKEFELARKHVFLHWDGEVSNV